MRQPTTEQESRSLLERTLQTAADVERVNPALAARLLAQAVRLEQDIASTLQQRPGGRRK